MTRLKTVRIRNVQDAPLPLPPLPNAGGVSVAVLPPGQYELRLRPDAMVEVFCMDAAQTTGDQAPMTATDVQRRNRVFWDRQSGAAR